VNPIHLDIAFYIMISASLVAFVALIGWLISSYKVSKNRPRILLISLPALPKLTNLMEETCASILGMDTPAKKNREKR